MGRHLKPFTVPDVGPDRYHRRRMGNPAHATTDERAHAWISVAGSVL
jgi:hypothetical protein